MSNRQAAILNVVISVLFAVAIVLSATYLDLGSNSTVTGLLIAAWFVPFWTLSNWKGQNSLTREVNCLRRLFSRNQS